MAWEWRPLREGDLGGVAALATAAFPAHHEDPACFAERLALSPAWCWALTDGADALGGYLIAYPWRLGSIPPLNTRLGALPNPCAALFLHDLALAPAAAGSGQAAAIIELVARRAWTAGFAEIALVAVNGSAGFWRRRGFIEVPVTGEMAAKLASYGDDARYMRRHLPA